MRSHSRARRLALAALCAGGTVGGTALMAAPGQALAATCSNLYGSGSTLQTQVQQNVLTGGYTASAPGACSPNPNVYYNTDTSGNPLGGTGSGAGLTEFALQGSPAAVTPSKSSNGSWLDGFIGTDDPPSASAMSGAATAAASHPEVVPVTQAPVAVIVHLPAGCTISSAPMFTNADLSKAFANSSSQHIDWTALLTDAGASPSGCPTTGNPTVQVRYDGSGTSYAFKQYLSQIDSTTWGSYVSDSVSWPGTVSTSYSGGNNQGSGGEAKAVNATAGSIGYVNLADAESNSIADYPNTGQSAFIVKVQNNGTSTPVQGAFPDDGVGDANCPTSYSGTVPSGDEADWTGVHVANPSVGGSAYSICTLTYDVAWQSYSGSSVLSPDYAGLYTGETASGVAASTKDYLSWLTSTSGGQSLLGTGYYAALPTNSTNVQQAANTIATTQVGQN